MNFLANSDDSRRSSENAARVENVSRRGVLKGIGVAGCFILFFDNE
jgi:hypothetical protein